MNKAPSVKIAGNAEFNYFDFDSLKEYEEFVGEETAKNLSQYNRNVLDNVVLKSKRQLSSGWFGEDKVKDVGELESHVSFQNPKLFQEVEKEIRNSLEAFEKVESTSTLQVKKIAYNSMGFGIFSFDRAAMGLTKIKTESGKEKITTTVKDVYAWFLNKPLHERSVKIYVVAGGNAGVQGKQMLYTGMSACVLADHLTQKDYSVEINVIIGSSPGDRRKYMGIIKVKKVEDFLDRNLIALLTSDPKYFRYKGFKSIIALYNSFGQNTADGLGQMVAKDDVEKFVQAENTKFTTPIILQQNYSIEDCRSNIIKEINRIKNKENANTNRD